MEKRSCLNCKYGVIVSGAPGSYNDPPEPGGFEECSNLDVSDDIIEKYIGEDEGGVVLAEHCGHYEPSMIDSCVYCGLKMNVPEYDWNIWAKGLERVPCCSELCRARWQHQFEVEVTP
jgi:hypothetical protein